MTRTITIKLKKTKARKAFMTIMRDILMADTRQENLKIRSSFFNKREKKYLAISSYKGIKVRI